MGFNAESSFQKRPITTEVGAGGGAGMSSKCMYSAFKKWVQKHHAFTDVQALSTELEMLSSDTQLLLENRNMSSNENRITVMPILQWNFPPEASKNDLKVKTLAEDQKIGNAIFLRLLRDVWNNAHDIVSRKLTELLVKSETLHRQKEKSIHGITQQKDNNPRLLDTTTNVCEEKHGEEGVYIDIMRIGLGEEEKEWRGEENKWADAKQNYKERLRTTATDRDECKSIKEESCTFELYQKMKSDAGFQQRKLQYTKSAMHLLGIGRLNIMLKEDKDRKIERKHQEEVERIEEAR